MRLAGLVLSLVLCVSALAQDPAASWPSKPVRLILPFTLTVASHAINPTPYAKPPFNHLKDFAPVSMVGT